MPAEVHEVPREGVDAARDGMAVVGDGPDDRDAEGDPEDPLQVFNRTDQVREAIQHMLYRRLSQRNGIFAD
jgi:hypothetical protein